MSERQLRDTELNGKAQLSIWSMTHNTPFLFLSWNMIHFSSSIIEWLCLLPGQTIKREKKKKKSWLMFQLTFKQSLYWKHLPRCLRRHPCGVELLDYNKNIKCGVYSGMCAVFITKRLDTEQTSNILNEGGAALRMIWFTKT